MFVWVGFVCFILAMLAVDLGVLHRGAHTVSMREALLRSAGWISLGIGFSVFVYFAYALKWFGLGLSIDSVDGIANTGGLAATKYLTGYLVEQSLSVDNIFVMVTIFRFFDIPPRYQHRVLFWGILGAMVLRGAMIAIGATLIARFHWILYVFGAFLVLMGIRMFFVKTERADLERHPVMRLVHRLVPMTTHSHAGHFFVRAGKATAIEVATPGAPQRSDGAVAGVRAGALLLTPLGLALVVIELSDLLFALDSIPAIFAITADPFLVFTSNIFAILGLRSLYFAVAGLIERFRYLNVSIAVVLVVVGVKMLATSWFQVLFGPSSNFYLLGIIVIVLVAGVVASWLARADRVERS